MMKKYISLILVLAVLISTVLSVTSCHGAREIRGFEIPEGFDPDSNYEISFWAKNEGHNAQADVYRRAIEDFNAHYPKIKVNLKIYANYNDIYKDVLTNLQTGTTPNVCISYPDHVATYMTGENVIVPLDNLINDRSYGLGGTEIRFDAPRRDEMVDKFMDEGKIGNVQYTIPFVRSTEACYVNRDMVESLGYTLPENGILTWDFVWEVSEAAMAKNPDGTYKVNGQKVLIPFIYKSTDNMMIQMLEQLDAGYTTDSAEVRLFNDTTRDILNTVATHAKTGAFSTFEFSSYPGDYFNAGQCIFAIDSTAGATWIGSNSPHLDIDRENVVSFNTVVMAVPQYNTEKPEMISQGPSICLFNKDDAGEVMASWLFMQFLLTDGVQIDYSKTEGYIPVTEKAISSERYQSYINHEGDDSEEHYSVKLDATRLLTENIENTFITPVFNGSARVRQAAGELIDTVNKAPRRKQEVDSAYITKLFKTVTTQYKLNELEGVKSEDNPAVFDNDPLPLGSVMLLVGLGVSWAAIITVVTVQLVRKKRKSGKTDTDK